MYKSKMKNLKNKEKEMIDSFKKETKEFSYDINLLNEQRIKSEKSASTNLQKLSNSNNDKKPKSKPKSKEVFIKLNKDLDKVQERASDMGKEIKDREDMKLKFLEKQTKEREDKLKYDRQMKESQRLTEREKERQ